MEFIKKKLKSLRINDSWAYGNGFMVKRSVVGWSIQKHGVHVITSSDIETIAKEIKLTFIAIEVVKNHLGVEEILQI